MGLGKNMLACLLAAVVAPVPLRAASSGCAPGWQDATCLTRISHAVVPPPTCSASAGWSTTAPAKWIGSGYSAPQCNYQAAPTCPNAAGWTTVAGASWTGSSWTAPSCNYQAPPTCPSGYTETSAPSWNGSSWSAPDCQPPAPPPLPAASLMAACEASYSTAWATQQYTNTIDFMLTYIPSSYAWNFSDDNTGAPPQDTLVSLGDSAGQVVSYDGYSVLTNIAPTWWESDPNARLVLAEASVNGGYNLGVFYCAVDQQTGAVVYLNTAMQGCGGAGC